MCAKENQKSPDLRAGLFCGILKKNERGVENGKMSKDNKAGIQKAMISAMQV